MNEINRHDDIITGPFDPEALSGVMTNSAFTRNGLSRRDVLKLIGLSAAVAASESVLTSCAPLARALNATEEEVGKEKLKGSVKFGFNTHMRPTSDESESHNFEAFKRDVDYIAENGMKMIRLNLQEWDAVDNSASTKENIVWNEEKIEVYRQALAYAKEKGLEVNFVVTPPTFATEQYKDDINLYCEAIDSYYKGVAERFSELVDIYQILNEPDDHSFFTYADINRMPDESEVDYKNRYLSYVAKLGKVVQTANNSIKSVDQNVKTTVNVSKWVVPDPGIGIEEVAIFDAACGYVPGGQADGKCSTIDIITIDYYPDLDEKEIADIPSQIEYFRNRYGLPVIIGELGMQTGHWTELQQAQSINKTIDSVMGGSVLPQAILIYERRDQSLGDGTGNTYGLFDANENPKASVEAVMSTISKYQIGGNNDK